MTQYGRERFHIHAVFQRQRRECMIKLLHAADLHLDSPFEGLGESKAAVRRTEQRQLLYRIAQLAHNEKVHLVLLAGDLLDSDSAYAETGEELVKALGGIEAPVFISPGNHDFYSARSPYARLKLPDNVHIFKSPRIECVELPELGVRVWGAAFTDKYSGGMLRGFSAEKTAGVLDIMCIHGEVNAASAYNPVTEDEIAASGMDYIAFGHIHAGSGLKKAGSCYYSWPGCPEGRGFDETGEKYVSIVSFGDGKCSVEDVRPEVAADIENSLTLKAEAEKKISAAPAIICLILALIAAAAGIFLSPYAYAAAALLCIIAVLLFVRQGRAKAAAYEAGKQRRRILSKYKAENEDDIKTCEAEYLELYERFRQAEAEEKAVAGRLEEMRRHQEQTEDMAAQEAGMSVFLITDCMINRENKDISVYPHGSFEQLAEYVKKNK